MKSLQVLLVLWVTFAFGFRSAQRIHVHLNVHLQPWFGPLGGAGGSVDTWAGLGVTDELLALGLDMLARGACPSLRTSPDAVGVAVFAECRVCPGALPGSVVMVGTVFVPAFPRLGPLWRWFRMEEFELSCPSYSARSAKQRTRAQIDIYQQ